MPTAAATFPEAKFLFPKQVLRRRDTHPVRCAILAEYKIALGCPPKRLLELPDGIDVIEVGGLVSNMCVLTNVCYFQARYPEAQIIVHHKLCTSFNPELYEKAMAALEGLQIKIID